MQLTRALYRIRLIREDSFFRRDEKAIQNLKTTGQQTSNDMRNDVKAIQNLITIGRHVQPISVYNNSPTRNI